MKFINILTTLWCEPWLILPATHKQLCDIVNAHLSGVAHGADGIAQTFKKDDEDEDEFCVQMKDSIAVIPVAGVLGKHVGNMAKSSGTTDIDDIENALGECMLKPEIKGILLDVNSPGGTVTGIPELAKKIAVAAKQKPIAAYTDSLMASAAYWLASGTSAIYASESAQVGSIGVYMAWLDNSRAQEMAGIRTELIKRGKFKGVGLPGLALSDEAREMLQKSVDQVYEWFMGHVKKFRTDVPQEAMEGQTFYGNEAQKNDLVDAVGTIDDAMDELNYAINRASETNNKKGE